MNPNKPFGGTIQGWTLYDVFDDHQQLSGMIFDNPSGVWEDGEEITTSCIQHIDYEEHIVEVWNMVYVLGLPKDKFAEIVQVAKDLLEQKQSTDE